MTIEIVITCRLKGFKIELPGGLHKPQSHLCITKSRGGVFEEKIKMSAPNPQQQRF